MSSGCVFLWELVSTSFWISSLASLSPSAFGGIVPILLKSWGHHMVKGNKCVKVLHGLSSTIYISAILPLCQCDEKISPERSSISWYFTKYTLLPRGSCKYFLLFISEYLAVKDLPLSFWQTPCPHYPSDVLSFFEVIYSSSVSSASCIFRIKCYTTNYILINIAIQTVIVRLWCQYANKLSPHEG